jgi:hypothetical protein
MLHRSTCAGKFERPPANDNRDNGLSKIMQPKNRHAASLDMGKILGSASGR